MSARLPAALEVSALIRLADAAGGFGMVLRKGEPDAGTILVVFVDSQSIGQSKASAFERLPRADGSRSWVRTRTQDIENKQEFEAYLARRMAQDRDLWVVELTIADDEQFIRNLDQK